MYNYENDNIIFVSFVALDTNGACYLTTNGYISGQIRYFCFATNYMHTLVFFMTYSCIECIMALKEYYYFNTNLIRLNSFSLLNDNITHND